MNLSSRLLPFAASVLFGCVCAAENPAPAAAPPASSEFKIDRNTPIQFPVSLLRDGITHGEARILLDIDSEGRLVDTLVVAYTHRPFAEAALAAIRRWSFKPPQVNGEVVGTIADCSITFRIDGVLFHQRSGLPVFEKRDPFGEKFAYQPQELIALDRIPTPRHVQDPVYPQAWADQGMRGKVLIDFFIDETGTVRMPSTASNPYPLLAAAATAAIREWRFAPPLLKGHPVLAHCQQIFTFERDTPPR